MGGPIVRTGTNPKFWQNWENVFGNKAGAGKKKAAAPAEAAAPEQAAESKKAAKPAKKKK